MIRALEMGDLESWKELWLAHLDFYRAKVNDEVTAATFARLSTKSDGLLGLVAADERGQLVGIIHLLFHPSTWSANVSCYVEDLFVSRAARGTGTAEKLLRAAFAEADRVGADRTYWETQEYNSAARSLYDQVAHRTSQIVYER